jgi:prefoldin subunit 2
MERLRGELQSLGDKISELEMDADEHRLVIAALEPLPVDRKCWRRIGGVLVETDVEHTLPPLRTQLGGIESSLEKLQTAYKKKSDELDRQLASTSSNDDK